MPVNTRANARNNILDFVIVSHAHLINNGAVGEHLSSCDHKLVRAAISTITNVLKNKTLLPNFRRGNFENFRRAVLRSHLPKLMHGLISEMKY